MMNFFKVGKIPFTEFELRWINRNEELGKDFETWMYSIKIFGQKFHGYIDIDDGKNLLEEVFKKLKKEVENILNSIKNNSEILYEND